MDLHGKRDKRFISEFIPRVSRTFALAMKFLPPKLRHPVYTAYLLCRTADTIEDSPYFGADEKRARLSRLQRLLFDAGRGITLAPDDIAPLYDSVNESNGYDQKLLGKSMELFGLLKRLPDEKQRIIYRWAGEMAGGMAEYARGAADGRKTLLLLDDTDEWEKYCYYVAGTVGHMLTELWIDEYDFDPVLSAELKTLCNSFGLGLQKVNTIKDAPSDGKRGMIFLPGNIMRKHGLSLDSLMAASNQRAVSAFVHELAESAQAHLDDAVQYTALIPTRLKGVRMFLTVPIFLAAETLNAIRKYPVQTMIGPPVKITRRDVVRLTAAARKHSPSNDALRRYYLKLRRTTSS